VAHLPVGTSASSPSSHVIVPLIPAPGQDDLTGLDLLVQLCIDPGLPYVPSAEEG
jgi:hypothetical protein